MGGFGRPWRGFGVAHVPMSLEACHREERILVGHETVTDHELVGYRIWSDGEPGTPP